ncbi:hypothetical protein [Microbacterium sp. P04]|uniref:hypothetical protein n=1 Tax=Microbacterium sp. P04 TaxID=3366947 RepID=UPI003744B4E1
MSTNTSKPGTPEWEAAIKQIQAAEQPIIADLRSIGYDVSSVWLLQTRPDALPILMGHLERGGYPDRVMEGLGQAISRAKPVRYWDQLRDRYLNARSPGEATGAVAALTEAATPENYDDLVAILRNDKLGPERVLFIRPLLRVGGDRGEAEVKSLLNHPMLRHEAAAALDAVSSKRRKRYVRARAHLDAAVDARPAPSLDSQATEWSTSLDRSDWTSLTTFLARELGEELKGPLGEALFTLVATAPPGDEDQVVMATKLGAVCLRWLIDDVDTVDVSLYGSQEVTGLCDEWFTANIDGLRSRE